MQLHEKHKAQGFEAITMNMEGADKLDVAKATLERLKIPLTSFCLAEGMDDEAALAAVQANGVLSEVNLYDRQGKVRYHFEGLIDHEEVEKHVVELLQEQE